MKFLTANDLASGRVIYWGEEGQPTAFISQARLIAPEEAPAMLAQAQAQAGIYVNPYLIDVEERQPNGRDRLKESIRSVGPTVGHSRPSQPVAEVA